MNGPAGGIEVGLSAAIVAVADRTPLILVTGAADERPGLPAGPFEPRHHRTMELALRGFVERQAALDLGHIEQLYTFGDRGRQAGASAAGPHTVSVGYLALTRLPDDRAAEFHDATFQEGGARWLPWYRLFPYEDWRGGRPEALDAIDRALRAWGQAPGAERPGAPSRADRLRLAFGTGGFPLDEERVLERYELLYEAGLVAEAVADGRVPPGTQPLAGLGESMRHDHRRIVATAIARLRAKLKYRPVVFELIAEEFTLTELQETVEAISGRHLHKQNFRRLVDGARLVEPVGRRSSRTGGRPAALFRFRREIVRERPHPGLRLGRPS